MASPLSEQAFDALLDRLEVAHFRASASQDPSSAKLLLRELEATRDFLLAAVREGNPLVSTLFGVDCSKIVRVCILLEDVRLPEAAVPIMFLPSCFAAYSAVERMLQEQGLQATLEEAYATERIETPMLPKAAASPGNRASIHNGGWASLDSSSGGTRDAPDEQVTKSLHRESVGTLHLVAYPIKQQQTPVIVHSDSRSNVAVARTQISQEQSPVVAGDVKTVGGYPSAQQDLSKSVKGSIGKANIIAMAAEAAIGLHRHESTGKLTSLDQRTLLSVELVTAIDLCSPEYRVGDLAAGVLTMDSNRLESVYVELQLGETKVQCNPGVTDSRSRRATFSQRVHLPFAGEPMLIVRVRDKRRMQSMFRGDPLIGEGFLLVSPAAFDGTRRNQDVHLKRGGKVSGMLSLKYQVSDSIGIAQTESPQTSTFSPQLDVKHSDVKQAAPDSPQASISTHDDSFDGGTGSTSASDGEPGPFHDWDSRLGRGSWAVAFRKASGSRKEALRLLFATSIVTQLELSDDLTIISDEHIDECIAIADGFLNRNSFDAWVRSSDMAKQQFEKELATLYEKKFTQLPIA